MAAFLEGYQSKLALNLIWPSLGWQLLAGGLCPEVAFVQRFDCTSVNDVLGIMTICQQRPIWIKNDQSNSHFYQSTFVKQPLLGIPRVVVVHRFACTVKPVQRLPTNNNHMSTKISLNPSPSKWILFFWGTSDSRPSIEFLGPKGAGCAQEVEAA